MVSFVNNNGWRGCGTILNMSLNAYAAAGVVAAVSLVAGHVFESSYVCAVAAVWGTIGTVSLIVAGTALLGLFLASVGCIRISTGRPLSQHDVVA